MPRWDGSEWSSLGDQVVYSWSDVVVFQDTLIANVVYPVNGGNRAIVSKWTGTAWVPLADGLAAYVSGASSLEIYNGKLYTDSGIANFGGIARWNGTVFEPLGSGVASDVDDGAVRALLPYNGSLYAGGRFSHAGGKPSAAIARWDDVITPVLVEELTATRTADGVRISWRLSPAAVSALRTIHLERADHPTGPYAEPNSIPFRPERDMSYTDYDILSDHTYWYRLRAVASTGEEFFAGPVEAASDDAVPFVRLYTPMDRATAPEFPSATALVEGGPRSDSRSSQPPDDCSGSSTVGSLPQANMS